MKSSNHMEKEGLCRALTFLAANSLEVSTLITDRHKQINKYIAKKHPDIEHQYDVWHVSKGKLLALKPTYLNILSHFRTEEETG